MRTDATEHDVYRGLYAAMKLWLMSDWQPMKFASREAGAMSITLGVSDAGCPTSQD